MLLSLLTACSQNGLSTEGTVKQICADWPVIRPSRARDKISEPTARTIADVNTANEQWCPARLVTQPRTS